MAGDGWTTARLGDVAKINPDAIGQDWPHKFIHYIDISSVGEGQIQVSPQLMTLADAPSRAKRLLRTGDTVLSTVRPNRRSMFFAAQPGDDWVVSTGFAVLRPQVTMIVPRFLYACVFNQLFTEYLISREKGAAYPAVSPEDIANAVIPLPPLQEQQAIACILGALDDKIEVNRRMNRTLEEIARAIFKSWFVDFDPVHAKAAVRSAHPGWTNEQISRAACPNLKPEIAALFPDSFQDSDLGEIPEGWRVASLQDVLAELETGSRPAGGVSRYSSGVPSVGAESIAGLGAFDYSKTRYVPRSFFDSMTKGHVRSRDVLLYKDGGRPGEFEPHVTLFGDGFPFSEYAINEHVYRMRVSDELGQNLLYFWLSSDPVMEEMRIKGTGVAIPGLNSTQVKSLAMLLPTPSIAAVFENLVEPCIARLLASCTESRSLALLRDTLLPKLLSGELRVKDAQRFEEVAS